MNSVHLESSAAVLRVGDRRGPCPSSRPSSGAEVGLEMAASAPSAKALAVHVTVRETAAAVPRVHVYLRPERIAPIQPEPKHSRAQYGQDCHRDADYGAEAEACYGVAVAAAGRVRLLLIFLVLPASASATASATATATATAASCAPTS